ncbi:MAG: hypothetical protein GC185_08320 [Alphaproteobacteria bacterium]|nr:hypothetical protein [Alphaproteobacteria bacterium]
MPDTAQQNKQDGKKGPVVLVYIGSDDPARGDAHGAEGVGRKIAQKTGGSFHFVSDADLAARYPEDKDKPAQLAHYFKDNGKPDVLISKFWRIHDKALAGHKPLVVYEDTNEYMSQKYLGEKALVNHHVTPEKLASEGEKFRAHYPDLNAPLIGVLMAHIFDVKGFAEKLVAKAAATPQATIFVTTIWRTREENYKDLMEKLAQETAAKGAQDRIRIIGVPYTRPQPGVTPPYNPYLGLLDQADQIVVAGNSLSMLTEPMAAGKAPLLYEPGMDASSLEQKGLVRDFNKSAAQHAPFDAGRITPFNPTDAIAEKMAAEFRKNAFKRKLNPATWVRALGKAMKR